MNRDPEETDEPRQAHAPRLDGLSVERSPGDPNRRPHWKVDRDYRVTDILWSDLQEHFPDQFFRDPDGVVKRFDPVSQTFSTIKRSADLQAFVNRSTLWQRERRAPDGKSFVKENEMVEAKWVDSMLRFPEKPIPVLRRVSHCPMLVDGEILDTYGYHEKGQVFLLWEGGRIDLSSMTFEDAVEFLEEHLLSSAFVDEGDRFRALGLYLLTILRPLIDGPTPFYLISSSEQESGKSYVGELAYALMMGKDPTPVNMPAWNDEAERQMDAAIQQHPHFLWLDNLRTGSTLGGNQFDMYTTSIGPVAVRAYGTHDHIRVLIRGILAGSGNEINMSPETARRVQEIKILPKKLQTKPRPLISTKDWILSDPKNRAYTITALLKLVERADEAGLAPVPMLGNFHEWSRLIGGILCAALPESAYLWADKPTRSRTDQELTVLFDHWHGKSPKPPELQVSAILKLIEGLELMTLLEDVDSPKGDSGRRIRLGKILTTVLDQRRVDGYVLTRRNHKDTNWYRISRVETPTSGT